jgi:hypothetical protein
MAALLETPDVPFGKAMERSDLDLAMSILQASNKLPSN